MNTITITKKSNTIYGFAWDIAITIANMGDQRTIWAELFGELTFDDLEDKLKAQAVAEGYTISETYFARRPGNSHGDALVTEKSRGVRFSTTKLIGFGDRAGLNLSTFINN